MSSAFYYLLYKIHLFWITSALESMFLAEYSLGVWNISQYSGLETFNILIISPYTAKQIVFN